MKIQVENKKETLKGRGNKIPMAAENFELFNQANGQNGSKFVLETHNWHI